MRIPEWGRISREDAIENLLYVVKIKKDGMLYDFFGLSSINENLVILREDGVHYFPGWSELKPSEGYSVTVSNTEEARKEFHDLIAQYEDRIRRLDSSKG
jgi:hypothetical protein